MKGEEYRIGDAKGVEWKERMEKGWKQKHKQKESKGGD